MENIHATFFLSLTTIEQHTASLNQNRVKQVCPICYQSDQWVSHGYLYRQCREKVGKRILCSKRYGQSGCGHTQALYIDDVIPKRRYRLSVLLAFVMALIKGSTVEQAYYRAVGYSHHASRQAWRWLSRLWSGMSGFRMNTLLCSSKRWVINARSKRLTLLLSTLAQYLSQLAQPHRIQCVMQHRFC